MKHLSLALPIVSLFIHSACNSGPRNLDEFMVDVSEFNIDKNALKDMEEVEILGSSGNITTEHEIDFYTLVVVRSIETGDTVNVLMTTFNLIDVQNRQTKFISNNGITGKLLETTPDPDANGKVNLKDLKAKTYKKVLYDTEYIDVDVRKFPTITGILGDYHTEGDLDIEEVFSK